MAYQPRHAIIGVEIDGCDFTTDTEFLPWVHKQTTEGIERYQPCVVHGVKINGVWFDACAMGDDFIEEMEYEIQQMPLNAEGDIDEAAIRMGKDVMEKRAAEAAQTEHRHKTLDDPRLQELFSATIDGALTTGYQGGKAPPVGHWLTFWYDKGRAVALAEAAQPAFDVCRILLDVVPGPDGMGHEVYAKSVKDVEDKLTELGGKAEELASLWAAQTEFPAGAIVNGRTLLDRLESTYSFECDAGPLRLCSDWHALRQCFEHLAEHAAQGNQHLSHHSKR